MLWEHSAYSRNIHIIVKFNNNVAHYLYVIVCNDT